MDRAIDMLSLMAEMYNQTMSPARIALMIDDLKEYSEAEILEALKLCRRELRFMPTIADIRDRIPGGHLSADEAWSICPKNEDDSAVWTPEIAEAFGSAYPLLQSGDHVAARMAFKSAYERIVSQSQNSQPEWMPSLGHDKRGREAAIMEAVDRGRIKPSHAAALLPESYPSETKAIGLTSAKQLIASMCDSGALGIAILNETTRSKGERAKSDGEP